MTGPSGTPDAVSATPPGGRGEESLARRVWLGLGGLSAIALAAACTGGERPHRSAHDEQGPPLIIAIPDSVATSVGLDSARRARTVTVAVNALVRPDPDHLRPVLITGTSEAWITRITLPRRVARGDTLLHLRTSGVEADHLMLAQASGWWLPWRRAGDGMWPGDTAGVIQHEGRFVAVGYAEAIEVVQLRVGDLARVTLPGKPRIEVPGRVGAITGSRYGAEVAVHFHRSGDTLLTGALVDIRILPAKPSDSVFVVPPTAIVRLSPGPAVFVSRGAGLYEIRFVVSDEHGTDGIIVHRGLEGPTSVAVTGLRPLLAAAQDSIKARGRRPR